MVNNPGGGGITLSNGFTIEQGGEAKLWVEIVGKDTIRPGREQSYNIFYGNRGNINVNDVILWIAIPESINFTVDVPCWQNTDSSLEDTIVIRNSYYYLWFFSNKLDVNETKSFKIRFNKISSLEQIEIRSGIFEIFKINLIQDTLLSNKFVSRKITFLTKPNFLIEGFWQPKLPSESQQNVKPQVGDIVFKLSDIKDPLPVGHIGICVSNEPDVVIIDFVLEKGKGIYRQKSLKDWSTDITTGIDMYKGSARPPGLSDTDAKKAADVA
ncbi:hypothetical protein HY745_08135, partial [Candidatus Desantisbacteria bacterium]|nr:hypothetical protein [Candidatus Desantisbacteria bacterium]